MQYDINLKIMGQRIKESRLKLGLTQEQLAENCQPICSTLI